MEGTEAHDTYYVYDSYGNLRAVLPPLAADALDMDTWGESDLEQYAYLYKYDSRNRQIAKKLPGAGWVYYVYDNADQLIFSQDSEQRARGEWSFNIPDALGRTVLTGTCTNNLNYTQQLSNAVRANWENTTTQYKGYSIDPDILELESPRLLTVNFYDSYEFMGKNDIPAGNHSDYKYDGLQGYAGRYPDSFKGLNTGTLTACLTNRKPLPSPSRSCITITGEDPHKSIPDSD